MLNFTYYNPTKLVFGKDAEKTIGQEISAYSGPGNYILIYGGGSAKRTGLIGRVQKELKASGINATEFSGVHPNPDINFVRDINNYYKNLDKDSIKGIIAVGGGSVIDTAKALAISFNYSGDAADFFVGKAVATSALPVFTVLTIPAAGSEQSIRAVLTCDGLKLGLGSEHIRPKISFINPELFFTLPKNQIANGVIDMASHIMERYFSNTTNTDYIDSQIEAALRTIFNFGPKVLAHPDNYDYWCQIALAATFAHNGYFGLGREEDWACHAIEHAISGWKPSVAHGAGLAVVIPAWMRYTSRETMTRYIQFARRVWGLLDPSDILLVEKGIKAFTDWCRVMELPTTLRELGIEDAPIKELAKRAVYPAGVIGHMVKLDERKVEEIFQEMRTN